MAFSIVIKENNPDIFNLLRDRLSISFPDAYIINNESTNFNETMSLSEFTTCISNNKTNALEDTEIPLYTVTNNGIYIIDCSSIINSITALKGSSQKDTSSNTSNKMNLLVSFAYIEERENVIQKDFSTLKNEADFPIRIDLMSGIRMSQSIKSGISTGSLTQLLREASSPKFIPKRILDYVNPEISGFLTPGQPENSDDVFEIGIKACGKLLKHLRQLVYQNDIDANSLVVIEGFRMNEIKQLVPYFDNIHFLLPSRMCDESIGLKETINEFKLSIDDSQQLLIHYCNSKLAEQQNETIRI